MKRSVAQTDDPKGKSSFSSRPAPPSLTLLSVKGGGYPLLSWIDNADESSLVFVLVFIFVDQRYTSLVQLSAQSNLSFDPWLRLSPHIVTVYAHTHTHKIGHFIKYFRWQGFVFFFLRRDSAASLAFVRRPSIFRQCLFVLFHSATHNGFDDKYT